MGRPAHRRLLAWHSLCLAGIGDHQSKRKHMHVVRAPAPARDGCRPPEWINQWHCAIDGGGGRVGRSGIGRASLEEMAAPCKTTAAAPGSRPAGWAP